ncbi:hypothetical protein DFH09DRAFT_1083954 [Mycena vulgaris]|nr:hypothetical protein DFH09DRAFT_1097871 [Mycena vulgaris]KAJ6558863.1 hypothetical protein DFH09DRAFT_1083954 [Mycena vulgaris]
MAPSVGGRDRRSFRAFKKVWFIRSTNGTKHRAHVQHQEWVDVIEEVSVHPKLIAYGEPSIGHRTGTQFGRGANVPNTAHTFKHQHQEWVEVIEGVLMHSKVHRFYSSEMCSNGTQMNRALVALREYDSSEVQMGPNTMHVFKFMKYMVSVRGQERGKEEEEVRVQREREHEKEAAARAHWEKEGGHREEEEIQPPPKKRGRKCKADEQLVPEDVPVSDDERARGCPSRTCKTPKEAEEERKKQLAATFCGAGRPG